MAIIPMHKNKMVQAALGYAAIGWHVIPCWWIETNKETSKLQCACGNTDCKSPGKHPIGHLVKRGQDDASIDTDTIKSWWDKYQQANIAVFLAPSKLVGIDIDPRNGGFQSIDELEAQYGNLVSELLQYSGGGGEHRIFQRPDHLNLPGTLGKGIDVKVNGYLMMEPSNHISGGEYSWEASSDPREGNVASPMPDWIRDLAGVSRAVSTSAMQYADTAANVISEETKADLLDALQSIPSDERDVWVRIGMSLHACHDKQWAFAAWDDWSQSSRKYDPVDQIRVWRSFRSNKGVEDTSTHLSIFAKAKQFGWRVVAQEAKPVIDMQELRDMTARTIYERVEAIEVFPGVGQCPVGAINDLTHWFTRQFEETHPLTSLAGAIAVFSACAARRYESAFKDPASIMLAVLSPSVSQGRYALNGTEQVMFEAGMRAMLRTTRMTSPQQLYTTLHRQPAVVYLADDYGDQLRFAKRQPSGLLEQTLTMLTGRIHAGQTLILDNWAELGIKQPDGESAQPIIYRPALSMLATIGSANMVHLFKSTEFSRGAADAVLFVPALNQADWLQRPKAELSQVPANVIELIRKLRGFETADTTQLSAEQIFGGNAGLDATHQTVRFTGAVQQVEASWITAYSNKGNQVRQLASGARKMLRRLCVTLGACANTADPIANEEIVTWAASFVRYCLDATIQAANLHSSQEEDKPDAYQRSVEYIDQFGPEGASRRELQQGCRPYRSLTPEKRELLVGQMIEDEEIYEVPTKSGKGKKLVRACYVNVKKAGVDASAANVDASVDKTSTQQVFDLKRKNSCVDV